MCIELGIGSLPIVLLGLARMEIGLDFGFWVFLTTFRTGFDRFLFAMGKPPIKNTYVYRVQTGSPSI